MGKIIIGGMVLGVYQTNCYFLYREGAKECIVVDPADQGAQIYKALKKNGFEVSAILLTHGHCDHIWGSRDLRHLTGAKIYALDAERELLMSPKLNTSDEMGRPYSVDADVYLKDGDELTIADMTFKVIATPGHTIGGCGYYFEEAGFLVGGDTLFAGSVGRTDFPTGDMDALIRSIKERLFLLPDDTKVYPGHGGSTTIGYEKEHNPFCQ